MTKKIRKHADGSKCLEGTQRLPSEFSACCEQFSERTLACYYDIRYEWWPNFKNWFVVIPESAGGGGIAFRFCPHCGKKLSGRRRDGRWMEI